MRFGILIVLLFIVWSIEMNKPPSRTEKRNVDLFWSFAASQWFSSAAIYQGIFKCPTLSTDNLTNIWFRIVINMYEFINQNDVLACKIFGQDWWPPRWARILNEISNSLLIINASSNFVLYCVVAKSFREQIVKFCYKWFSNQSSQHSESPQRLGQVDIELQAMDQQEAEDLI